ncbi:MAG: DUF1801 domain-containing protein [Bacteroidota bacterium]
MEYSKSVEEYIRKNDQWSTEIQEIRSIINESELQEEVKWGAPAYTLNGKILVGIGAFKNHMGIWFHQGVFLKDKHKKLMNAQEGKTKALRQWRIEKGAAVEADILRDYVQEAIENSLAGKEIKPERKKGVEVPELLVNTFKKESQLKEAFFNLTPGKQREYAEYISTAKREATQLSRLEKIVPMIQQGIGLNDKYRNC